MTGDHEPIHLAGTLWLVPGENQGRFPRAHSFLIKDKQTALIDTGAGREVLKHLAAELSVDLVLITHLPPRPHCRKLSLWQKRDIGARAGGRFGRKPGQALRALDGLKRADQPMAPVHTPANGFRRPGPHRLFQAGTGDKNRPHPPGGDPHPRTCKGSLLLLFSGLAGCLKRGHRPYPLWSPGTVIRNATWINSGPRSPRLRR